MSIQLLRSIAIILSAPMLVSCGAGTPLPAAADEILIPQIAADGSKFFVYQRRNLHPEPDPTDHLLARTPTVTTPRSRQESSQFRGPEVENRVSAVLAFTAYCRDGWFELYRDATREGFSLRGECREDASEDDRLRFTGAPISVRGSLQ
jgi:hypothetical protein